MEATSCENHDNWSVGRAGMLYRDLTPAGFEDQIIVSHIRLPFEGEVPDYVHYHKVEFQVIYCIRGRIKVVYEDQGPPFWLTAGDLVLQPPEIRHRVLECEANSEVIEVTMPAEHETRADHELTLPTPELKPDRIFGTQPFVRLIGAKNKRPEANFGLALASLSKILPKNECIITAIQCITPTIHRIMPSDSRPEPS